MSKYNIYALFHIDENGNEFRLKSHELTHPLVKAIYDRDKGSKGDFNGVKKLIAIKELKYVWFFCDTDSVGFTRGLADNERHIEAIKYAELREDYKPDDAVNALIEDYLKYGRGPYAQLFNTAIRSCNAMSILLDNLLAQCENDMAIIKDPIGKGVDHEGYTLAFSDILGCFKEIHKLSTEIPITKKKLADALQAYLMEKEEDIAWGGKIVETSMKEDRLNKLIKYGKK